MNQESTSNTYLVTEEVAIATTTIPGETEEENLPGKCENIINNQTLQEIATHKMTDKEMQRAQENHKQEEDEGEYTMRAFNKAAREADISTRALSKRVKKQNTVNSLKSEEPIQKEQLPKVNDDQNINMEYKVCQYSTGL